MSRHIVRAVAFLALAVLAAAPSLAAERGTPQEAQALLEKAIALYKQAGAQAAMARISDPKGGFVDRDLYVFVFGPDRKVVAHGADPKQIGNDVTTLKDVDGKAFGLAMLAAPEAGAWVDYKWQNPVSKVVEPKSSFVKRVAGYVFGVGAYK
jgi:signal transduction histidine kinase